MPIYEYRCADCDEVFEVVRSIDERDRTGSVTCPTCEGKRIRRCSSRVTVETPRKSYHPAKPVDV